MNSHIVISHENMIIVTSNLQSGVLRIIIYYYIWIALLFVMSVTKYLLIWVFWIIIHIIISYFYGIFYICFGLGAKVRPSISQTPRLSKKSNKKTICCWFLTILCVLQMSIAQSFTYFYWSQNMKAYGKCTVWVGTCLCRLLAW